MFIRRLGAGLLLTLIAAAVLAASAGAATVANTNDAGPGSLRQAILDATIGETISVPAGTYTLTSGELVIEKELTIAGAGAAVTTIRSGGVFRVVKAMGQGFEVAISGVTIRDGQAFGQSAVGGGILMSAGFLTLSRVIVIANTANTPTGGPAAFAAGGGIAAVEGAHLKLLDSVVRGNIATAGGLAGERGGIAVGGGIGGLESTLIVERSTISDNRADARGGQGTPDPNQLGGNASGGGIFNGEGASAIQGEGTTISASTIARNVSEAGNGAGAAPSGHSEGGGIAITAGKPASLTASTIDGNIARAGGLSAGGGIYLATGKNGTVALGADTIAANTVESELGAGGGNLFALDPSVTIADTIVSAGAADAAKENCGGTAPKSLGFNLEDRDQCGLHAAGDIVGKDPMLGPLQDNGGPTETRLPAANSPVVDQGSATGADQRGLPRPSDFPAIANSAAAGANGADIGAVELQAPPPPPPPTISFGKLTRNPKNGTARLTVNISNPAGGTLVLTGSGLRTARAAVTGTTATLPLLPTRAATKALAKSGRRKIALHVSYLSPAGAVLASADRTSTLLRTRHPHRRPAHP